MHYSAFLSRSCLQWIYAYIRPLESSKLDNGQDKSTCTWGHVVAACGGGGGGGGGDGGGGGGGGRSDGGN